LTNSEKQTWITTGEICERLDCSKFLLGGLRKKGEVSFKEKDGKFLWPWPKAQKEFEVAQSKKRQQVASNLGRPKFDLNSNEYAHMQAYEKVIAACEMGAKNAPDIAYSYHKAVEQQVKARLASLKLLEAEGKTLEREEVEQFIFTTSRNNRDVWLNWPEIVSVKMAEQLGVPSKKLHDVLKRAVHEQLERNATMPIVINPEDDERVLSERAEASGDDDG